MKDVYIVGAARTAIGAFGGALKDMPPAHLGAVMIKSVLERAGVSAECVDEVIMGNVLQAGMGQNTARQAAIKAGIPVGTTAFVLNKVCGSGLKSVSLAAALVRSGEAGCVVAGGMETMSMAPYISKKTRWGARMGSVELEDSMITEGLWDVFNDYHMGITAENVALKYGITREEQDAFALASQQKACAAIKVGIFSKEIVPVSVPQRKGDPVVFDTDEFPRPGTTIEKLAKLRPAFKKDGTVTAGNASGINDGAAAVLVADEETVKAYGLKPMARIVAGGTAGIDPAVMGLGPIEATRNALRKTGMKLADIDLIEANEAFASQSIAVVRELALDMEKVNVNGGAIALGHPIGASGARILVTLLYEMKRRQAGRGLATLCIGGGMGESLIVEVV